MFWTYPDKKLNEDTVYIHKTSNSLHSVIRNLIPGISAPSHL